MFVTCSFQYVAESEQILKPLFRYMLKRNPTWIHLYVTMKAVMTQGLNVEIFLLFSELRDIMGNAFVSNDPIPNRTPVPDG